MINIDLKARFKNKAFIVALISAVVILLQQIGLKQYIPSNWNDILNTCLTIAMLLGVVVDTSTPGINDQVVADSTVQAVNATNTQEKVKTESSTTSINSTVTQNSASSKITVDNPENVQEIGVVVNPISASTPQ